MSLADLVLVVWLAVYSAATLRRPEESPEDTRRASPLVDWLSIGNAALLAWGQFDARNAVSGITSLGLLIAAVVAVAIAVDRIAEIRQARNPGRYL